VQFEYDGPLGDLATDLGNTIPLVGEEDPSSSEGGDLIRRVKMGDSKAPPRLFEMFSLLFPSLFVIKQFHQ